MRIQYVFFALLLSGCGSEDNYDECILKHMEGVKSDHGAKLIQESCYEKYNKIEIPEGVRKLSQNEQLKVTGRAGVGYSHDYYSGSIYNGNESITITEVKIRITSKSNGSESSRDYIDSVSVSPLSTGKFGFSFMVGDKGSEYSWYIVSAKGYKSK